jgi:predicted DNA-binding transcriptional regulator YafY
MALLQDAGSHGVPADDLVSAGRYGGALEGQREQLQRDLRHLAARGWQIDNIAEPGSPARYRLAQGDPRIRLHFTQEQRAEFARVAALVGLADDKVESSSSGRDPAVRRAVNDAPGYSLALATHGHEHRCLLRFRYRDKLRIVASDAIWLRDGRWYLVGREVLEATPAEDWVTKNFRLDRMSELALDRPGTAPDAVGEPALNIDPLTFSDGDPVDAVVTTHPDLRYRVEVRLGKASSVRRTRDTLELTIPVTNRTTFRNRLYELDTRVRLLGPPELRDEVRDDLLAHLRTST